LTPSFRKLSAVANNNATTFLVMTLLFAITMLADLMLFPGNLLSIYPALLCCVLVTIVGLVTYLVLVIYSRKYLGRILSDWTNKSVQKVLDNGRLVLAASKGARDSDDRVDTDSVNMLAANLAALKGGNTTTIHVVLSVCIALVELLVALLPILQAKGIV